MYPNVINRFLAFKKSIINDSTGSSFWPANNIIAKINFIAFFNDTSIWISYYIFLEVEGLRVDWNRFKPDTWN